MTSRDQRALLDQQIDYYRARAQEYDQWFLRQGRYDRGSVHRMAWRREVSALEATLDAELGRLAKAKSDVRVLELAAGTGLWTRRLAARAGSVTAVDAAPEALAINRQREGCEAVSYVEADLFSWRPEEQFDLVFFAFWLSHIPKDRFEEFWTQVQGALAPKGRAFFIDSAFDPWSSARDHVLEDPDAEVVERKLNDGRRFEIIKIFYRPDELQTRLEDLGWTGAVRSTDRFFLHGSLSRKA